jgi:predicted methyltransferase MtxX (methanogen marker protein 4)
MISPALLSERIDDLLARGRPHIGLGLKSADPDLIGELASATEFAEILIVGPLGLELPPEWTVVRAAEPERKLASMLATGEIDGLLRGTLDAVKTLDAYMQASGEVDPTCPALIEDAHGRQFFLSAVTNHEGFTRAERLHEATITAAFMRQLGIEPRVAVYAAARHGTVNALEMQSDRVSRLLAESYRDAEWLADSLCSAGLNALNMTIELNVAIEQGYDLHVPVNGIIGNQIARAFMVSGGKMLAAPRIGFSRPYEDNSRTEGSLHHHVRWLTALANMCAAR